MYTHVLRQRLLRTDWKVLRIKTPINTDEYGAHLSPYSVVFYDAVTRTKINRTSDMEHMNNKLFPRASCLFRLFLIKERWGRVCMNKIFLYIFYQRELENNIWPSVWKYYYKRNINLVRAKRCKYTLENFPRNGKFSEVYMHLKGGPLKSFPYSSRVNLRHCIGWNWRKCLTLILLAGKKSLVSNKRKMSHD